MELRFCRGVDLPVPERMTGAYRVFDPSKLASELILLFGTHATQLYGSADNCSG